MYMQGMQVYIKFFIFRCAILQVGSFHCIIQYMTTIATRSSLYVDRCTMPGTFKYKMFTLNCGILQIMVSHHYWLLCISMIYSASQRTHIILVHVKWSSKQRNTGAFLYSCYIVCILFNCFCTWIFVYIYFLSSLEEV